MVEDKRKMVVQMTATKDEIKVVKLVAAMEEFDSVSEYIRDLVTRDISAKKRGHENPWIYGLRKIDWDVLTDDEKENFLSQIGPVIPASMDHFIDAVKNGNEFL
jgi:hypothetical protein